MTSLIFKEFLNFFKRSNLGGDTPQGTQMVLKVSSNLLIPKVVTKSNLGCDV